MPDPSFLPLHRAHAIEQVAFGINFDKEIGDEKFRVVRAAIGNPAELPSQVELRGLAISVTGPGIPMTAPIAGYAFRKFGEAGNVTAELVLLRNAISFRSSVYTRWANAWGEAKKYFLAVLAHYLGDSRLMQFNLNYVDKFVSSTPLADCRPAEILKADSPYLTPKVAAANDLWHCHTGFFERVDEQTKRLTTVNVDFIVETVPQASRPTVAISTVLAHLFNQAEYQPFSPSENEVSGVLEKHFGALHALDKELLGSIITADLARRIALTD